ncbi:MAG: GWxTD domain-containing protein [Bacteroidota bacterium]
MRALFFFWMLGSVQVLAQSIAGSNLSYLYDPSNDIEFATRLITSGDSSTVYFQLKSMGGQPVQDFQISWDRRESYGQRKGELINLVPIVLRSDTSGLVGRLGFRKEEKPWLLVANITNTKTAKQQLFFRQIEANYPVDGWAKASTGIVFKKHLPTGTPIAIPSGGYAFRYPQAFSAASPPFTEKEKKADPLLVADSIFRLSKETIFKTPGLYLVQRDTNSAQGFSFLVTDPVYPKFNQLQELVDPLIFICTREEFDKLRASGNDKVKFDKVILEITEDKERAKNFMRNYFRRVELANRYFTSYKEGWKTDRGMIYLIFGAPTNVSVTGDSEVWTYRNYQARFTFVKSGSIYDPEYFVLVREKRFAETWYNTIDLWRKGRL